MGHRVTTCNISAGSVTVLHRYCSVLSLQYLLTYIIRDAEYITDIDNLDIQSYMAIDIHKYMTSSHFLHCTLDADLKS